MSARIYCTIPETFRGFRELALMSAVANSAWCSTGEFWLMHDPETNEIFECAWNNKEGNIVAFREVPFAEFRMRLLGAAEQIISARIKQAIEKSAKETSELIAEAERFAEKLRQK